LHLTKPVCVSGDEFIDQAKNIDRIQIFPDYAERENQALLNGLRASVGKFVAIEGCEPFGAHTGHHHAPAVAAGNQNNGRAPSCFKVAG